MPALYIFMQAGTGTWIDFFSILLNLLQVEKGSVGTDLFDAMYTALLSFQALSSIYYTVFTLYYIQ